MRVSPEHFRSHLEELRASVEVATPPDVARSSERLRVVITFDDGYLDNHEVAAPLLERFELPATMFVTTKAGDEFWWDRLWHLFIEDPPSGMRLGISVAGSPLQLQLDGPVGGRRAYAALNRRLMRQPPDVVRSVLAQLEAALGRRSVPCRAHARMATEDLRRLDGGGLVHIGGHTRSHPCLTSLTDADAEGEIGGCRDDLTAMLGRAPSAFAYPYGAAGTFGRRDARMARAAGYGRAFINVAARARSSGDAFRTPRFVVGDWDRARFRAQLDRWADGLA
jgi:peptidoglycan/xylan/chitin deacetylase (PgdA/CDA1 family)